MYATFSDGLTQDITHVENFEFSVPDTFVTADVELANGQYVVTVLQGADSVSGHWLDVTLVGQNGNAIITGSPVVNISLPEATGINTGDNCGSKIARSGDRATDIFSIRTSCQLSISLLFPGNLINYIFPSYELKPTLQCLQFNPHRHR